MVEHEVQVVNYLNAINKEIGLLINFGPSGVGLNVSTKILKRKLDTSRRRRLSFVSFFRKLTKREDADSESDIDILVILDKVERYSNEIARTSNLVAELSLKYDKAISRVFVSQGDWAERETPFLLATRKEAIAA